MNNERFHPIIEEPPLAHALHHWDQDRGLLTYEYNGVNVIEVQVPAGTDLGFRHGSDGSMQSIQYIQQLYLASETPCTARITLRGHAGALNLRPHRARGEQAVLGTQPGVLSWGVNGFYDTEWDLLLDWHGLPWRWTAQAMEEQPDGWVAAVFEAELTMQALYLNLRPRYYGSYLGYRFHRPWLRRPNQKAVAGWCSWEAYRRDIDIGKVRAVADFLSKHLSPYGLEYLQVDDGYQAMPLPVKAEMTMAQGWMCCDSEKFPGGHESIVSAAAEKGLAPAIWVNANITNPDFPTAHPDAVIWHDGEPLTGEWIDFLYNCTPETLAAHVEPLFAALREKGYRYIKIDAIRHLLFDGLHECVRLGLMTNEDASARFRAFMEAGRRGMGEDMYYLASWGEMHEVVGVADACRISMDANPTWAGVRMQLFESARWFHAHRVLFLNDPDHVCVRTKPEWARSVLSLISLSGELYMLSDTAEAYTAEKLDILRRTLPPLTTSTGETGPLNLEYPAYTWTKLHGFAVQSHETPVEMEDVSAQEAANIAGWAPDRDNLHPFSSLWSFAMVHHGMNWRVMLRVATTPLASGRLPLERLALDPDKTYLAYDFWAQEFLGEVSGTVDCPPLALGCCQAVAFHQRPDHPAVIASDRHVSMDAVSILSHLWDGKALRLRLTGPVGETFRYHIWTPGGMSLALGEQRGCTAALEQGALTTAVVTFENKEADLCLTLA
ncbi:alpha-galactosidase [Pseudoflavonifractor sp. CLA-AP-H29]|uniref:Alpha-galactosidase n=1 Tax=Pseudoflavonifractor intestinihominis TaxID=3133171 RepID=A0ABV1E711_9FIRM